ncbi:MAG: Formate dehydrogenase subunit alpha precursor [Syntrophorhabdus sp. PtaU1.Bin002]|nr:MAG: Formate dehydrogenase subunit alpha precursor [Syntrophorhabdus sp. PtaU1.Bin002]
MTNHFIDIGNSDVMLIQGSNAAEHHPMAFKWAMKAQEKGAKIIHVDPRFTRTSSKADIYARLRSGTDIAFLGGMIKYIIEKKKYFKEYVLNYTNASYIVADSYGFKDGLFTGYDKAHRKYDKTMWAFKMNPDGTPQKDTTLQNPRCVFQLLKQHYSRYDVDKVSSITGTPKDDLLAVYETYASTGTAKRAGTIMYALGQTQHTTAVQNIRTMCIVQLLLGNIGIAGGGVNAMRGEPNVQGSTDFALLYHYLPGYLSAPKVSQTTLAEYITAITPTTKVANSINWQQNYPKYITSLLKTWFGAHGTKDNDFGYSWLPKIDDTQKADSLTLIDRMYKGKVKGYITAGTDPCVSMPNANKLRKAMKNLDWLVHVNIFDNETASFWKGPGVDPSKIKTEVFLLPAAASVEKDGSQSNSGRWIQWHYRAAAPPGDAISVGDVFYRITAKLKKLYQTQGGTFPEPILNLQLDYADAKGNFDPLKTAKAINGYFLEDKTIETKTKKDGQLVVETKTYKKGELVPGFPNLQSDGSTSSGMWLFCGAFTKDGKNNMIRRGKEDPTGLGMYPNWSYAWPMNRRIIYNRASVNPDGNPWNPDKAVIKWVDGKWVGDVADGGAPPMNQADGKLPFIMKPDGVSFLFGPGLGDGPFPEHYEPFEGPFAQNLMSPQRNSPIIKIFSSDMDQVANADPKYPIVMTTYSCVEHWCSGAMTRWQSHLTEMMPEAYVEMSEELAKEKGIKNGERVVLESIRGSVKVVAIVTKRFRPFKCGEKTVHQIGTTFNYGWLFPKDCGDTINLLTPTVGDGNTMTPEYKACMVNVKKA